MPITGSTGDLPLVDLVQANVLARNTCRITLVGHERTGFIYLQNGTVVHATYGNLEGKDAFFAMVAVPDLFYHVENGVLPPQRTITESFENLALEAMQRVDERRVPTQGAAAPAAPPRTPAVPRTAGRATTHAAPRRHRQGFFLVMLLSVSAAAAGGYLAFFYKPQETKKTSPSSAVSQAEEPLDVTELTLPGDRKPELLEGAPPRSPLPELALRPTIVCRILIDSDGTVREAKIFQSRLDLAPFEEAALRAVQTYRFRPAERAGRPVAVWINWPVTFQ